MAPSSLKMAVNNSDDDLNALERCLLVSLISVRKIQNQSHRIAARYPSELLSLIFAFVVGSMLQVHCGGYAHRYPDISSLVAVSQVCSRWRTVSTTDQSLWNGIPIMRFGPEFTRLLIERTGSMPLRFFAHPASPRYTSPVLKSLKPHSVRVQELIVGITRGDYSYLSDILSPLAPSLTYLSVVPTGGTSDGAYGAGTYAPSISSLIIANYDFQHIGKRVLDGLVAGDRSPNGHPFAALKHLVVQVDQPITDAKMLVNMVSARFRGQCALSTLTFSAPDGRAIPVAA
ncbi:hypothetical protein C8Q74DRAFT_1366017 [Fomes fomentarius]|nr:hypothetical protein C8Q74DRAFT_1366017 [Fomes fomentarius]